MEFPSPGRTDRLATIAVFCAKGSGGISCASSFGLHLDGVGAIFIVSLWSEIVSYLY